MTFKGVILVKKGANMLRVLQIVPYYPPHFGGIEQVAYDISECLKEHSVEQTVLCYSKGRSLRKEVFEGVSVFRVGVVAKVWSQAIPMHYKKVLEDVLSERDPDIIHIHLPNPIATCYLLLSMRKDKKKRKIVVHWHSDIIRQAWLMPFYSPFQKRMLSICAGIIATSENYANYSKYLKPFRSKITIIPNVVDGEKYQSLGLDYNQDYYERKDFVFFVGVHRKYKGLEYLIEAARRLPSRQFIIAGNGPETNKLKKQARYLHNVRFVGSVSEQDKCKYLRCARVFAFPSITKNEAFGLALAEALYFGLPAVCFDIVGSGVGWVNQNGKTGFVVPNRDVGAFVASIERLFSDDDLFTRFSQNAHDWVAESMNRNVLWSGVVKVYGIQSIQGEEY